MLLYLFVPISVIILFSFNDPAGKFNLTWHKFSTRRLDAPVRRAGAAGRGRALAEIALLSTLVATLLGTLMALALARYSFRGRGATNFAIFTPMATPEIVMGSSLLTLFIDAGEPSSRPRLLDDPDRPHHVQHQLRGGDREGPACTASTAGWRRRRWICTPTRARTFRRITLPLIMPGIAAAAALAFALSIDDFIVTQFNRGTEVTFPLFIYGASRNGVPVQVNVIGSAIFGIAVGGMLLNLATRTQGKRDAPSSGGWCAAQSAEAPSSNDRTRRR